MARVNVYKILYDESMAQSLISDQNTTKETVEEIQKEAQDIGLIIIANSLREALDKAEGQTLKYFKVFNVELKEANVNIM